MQLRIFTLLALSMASLAAAKQAMVIKESVSAPPDWVRRGPAPDLHRINLQIALKQRDVSTLEQQLLDIADPDSVNYGKWLNQEQVTSYLQPAEASIGAVRRWLAEHGIEEKVSKRSVAGDWITADVTVSQARALLGEADFAVWEHRSTGEQLVRAIEYSLPRNVAEHVDLVGPTTYFSQIRALNKQGKRSTTMHWEPVSTEVGDLFSDAIHPLLTSPDKMAKATKAAKGADGVPKVCNLSAVSMDCLRQFYRSYDYKVQNPTKQRIGISGFLEEYASFSDLKKFLSTQRPDAAAVDFKFDVALVNDGAVNDQSMPGGEANLDVQTVAGIGFNIPYTYYSTAGRPPYKPDLVTPTNTNEPYTTEFEYLLNLPDSELPDILSTSYGDDEQTVPINYQRRVCLEIAALGIRGVTVFFSSGDSGVGADGKCQSNDGKNTYKFLPSFPPSCPYVTTVGATEQ